MVNIFNMFATGMLLVIFVCVFNLFFDKKKFRYFLPVFSSLIITLCIDIIEINIQKYIIIYFFLLIFVVFSIFIFLKYEFGYKGLEYKKKISLLIKLFFVYYLILIFRTAWVSDDAYITFRVADNFINGFGLRWNIEERVQVFTNTLFLFIFIPFNFILNDVYFTALFLNFLFSILTILLLKKITDSGEKFLIIIAGICFSKAYIDFSTSGLENSLTFFILTLFLYILFKVQNSVKKIFYISLIFSFLFLNRPDAALIIMPAILLMLYKGRVFFKFFLWGLFPLFIWEIFSIIYYGFPLPNTFYAKLMTGINKYDLIKQGGHYFLNLMLADPASFFIISCAVIVNIFYSFKQKNILLVSLTSGIFLYLLYLLFSGGDFMAGRFFACLLPVSLFSIVNMIDNKKYLIAFMFLVFFLGLVSPYFSIWHFKTNNKEMVKISNQILSEREFYYPVTGLLNVLANGKSIIDKSGYAKDAERVKKDTAQQRKIGISSAIGMFGFYAGPEVYIMDQVSIADAFTSRIPAAKIWRIGHFARQWPEGYEKTKRSGVNLIEDKKLSEFYDKISIITTGKLFSKERLKAILKVNFRKDVYGTR